MKIWKEKIELMDFFTINKSNKLIIYKNSLILFYKYNNFINNFVNKKIFIKKYLNFIRNNILIIILKNKKTF